MEALTIMHDRAQRNDSMTAQQKHIDPGSGNPMRISLVLALGFAACTFDAGGIPGTDGGAGPSDARPPDAGTPDAQLVPCEPSVEYPVCLEDDTTLVDCVDGNEQATQCDHLSCIDDANPAPRCGTLTPSNNVSVDLLDNVNNTPITVDAEDYVIDSDTGQIVRCDNVELRPRGTGPIGGINFQTQTNGPASLGVFALHDINIVGNLYVIGRNSLVIVARQQIRIEGTVIASGGRRAASVDAACNGGVLVGTPGPGGFAGGAENMDGSGLDSGQGINEPGGTGLTAELGGGGGGHGAAGGQGGGMGAGAGGIANGATTLDPLTGGSGGAGGGKQDGTGGTGGGGGGAVQLTALDTILFVGNGGIIAAGGGGGPGSGDDAGGGGGAGGSILLEAPRIELGTGRLSANGGGGGGGRQNTTAGSDGDFGNQQATGGAGTHVGGPGGAADKPTGDNGGVTPNFTDGTGGGGGGVGRIYLRSRAPVTVAGAEISPNADQGVDLIQ